MEERSFKWRKKFAFNDKDRSLIDDLSKYYFGIHLLLILILFVLFFWKIKEYNILDDKVIYTVNNYHIMIEIHNNCISSIVHYTLIWLHVNFLLKLLSIITKYHRTSIDNSGCCLESSKWYIIKKWCFTLKF